VLYERAYLATFAPDTNADIKSHLLTDPFRPFYSRQSIFQLVRLCVSGHFKTESFKKSRNAVLAMLLLCCGDS
jgi:hypothetical protein